MNNELTYWFTLANIPKWGNAKVNKFVLNFFHDKKITIEEFFNLSEAVLQNEYSFSNQELLDFQNAKSALASNAFIVENLLSQGFEIIPITSSEYSPILKKNLKLSHAPSVLYIKGNRQILKESAIAIVGSRAAENISLEFTDNIAQKASKEFKVIVSGFAKGVDKQALDSALKYKGQSIIVLPQGIATFDSGFRKYYKQIVDGDVLVLSTYHPNTIWSAGHAMARNPVIYGLANEIYVAESAEKGGTWEGVSDGLKKGRTIYVRMPEVSEKNANKLLIAKGATPVDFEGNLIENNFNESSISNMPNTKESKIENLQVELFYSC